MSVNEESAASRCFEATAMWGKNAGTALAVICVTSDGLTVDQRPGEFFSSSDARLGLWTVPGCSIIQGTALHLRCGPNGFVLGGRDHRIATGTRLEAPPNPGCAAAMRASDFDELLTMVARRCGWDVRRPVPGEPMRCYLVPNTGSGWPDTDFRTMLPWIAFKQQQRRKKLPSLAIDVGNDAIWVTDRNTNAPIASVSVAQVTATPAIYTCAVGSAPFGNPVYTSPILVVGVPGLEPLTIGCPIVCYSFVSRFGWRGDVPRENRPDYLVSEADWRTLVEKFGLAPLLDEPETP